MRPERIQLKRTKGWRMPPNTVKVDRTTKWGNPFKASYYRDVIGYSDTFARQTAFEFFRECVYGRDEPINQEYQDRLDWIVKHARELKGKNLACWCKPDDLCHADVLLELANGGGNVR